MSYEKNVTKTTANVPTRVLFVGGYGRSGSTILDLLLDRIPGITAVGEFRHLFGRAIGDNELCSCGKPFNDCEYWGKILDKAFPRGYDRKRIQGAVEALNKVRLAPQLLDSNHLTLSLKQHIKIYHDAFSAAYKAVAEISGASVIIDSSKYPMHGMVVNSMPEVDMATMLLVRDPRAVAHSWQRRRIRPEVHWEKREMPRHSLAYSGLAWNMSNLLTEKINKDQRKFRLQRYEDFIENPLQTINEIASFALGGAIKAEEEIFNTQPNTPHTIAGNPVRIGSEHIKIKPDTEWQKQMSPQKQAIVTAICAPQMKRFGYRLRA